MSEAPLKERRDVDGFVKLAVIEGEKIENNNKESEVAASKNTGVIQLREQFNAYQDPLLLIDINLFLSSFDDLKENISDEAREDEKIIGNSLMLSAGMSVGYVVWLARSGVLLSSVISSLPAWRFMDPLPVLSNFNSEIIESEDEESLQSMVEESDDKKANEPNDEYL